jgi:hypothetical protein
MGEIATRKKKNFSAKTWTKSYVQNIPIYKKNNYNSKTAGFGISVRERINWALRPAGLAACFGGAI